jgi:hypothetical protein
MSYFVFDMDETLADMHSIYYFIASLRVKEIWDKDDEKEMGPLPENFIKKVDAAYEYFLTEVLKEETSKKPLGVLRPGILDIMENIYALQQNKQINHMLIYSNNGHLQSLEFVRDLIHKHLNTTTLIGECIHWNHHMRQEEKSNKPGYAVKTWNVLKNIIVNGHCGALPTLQTNEVFFFDDLDHPDLRVQLKDNYYKVPAYRFKASFDRLSDIYTKALEHAKVDEQEFIKYVFHVYKKPNILTPEDLDDLLILFLQVTQETVSEDTLPPKPDEGLEMMKDALNKANMMQSYIGGKKRRSFQPKETRQRKRRNYRKRGRTRRKN